MTPAPHLRPARRGDLAAVAAIARAAFGPFEAIIGRRPAPMEADHASDIDAGRVTVAVAEDGRLSGFATLDLRDDVAILEIVAVAPGVQGRGVGRALIERCEARAAGRPIRLWTNVAMTGALRLYPRLGYVETGRGRHEGFDRVFFEKRP